MTAVYRFLGIEEPTEKKATREKDCALSSISTNQCSDYDDNIFNNTDKNMNRSNTQGQVIIDNSLKMNSNDPYNQQTIGDTRIICKLDATFRPHIKLFEDKLNFIRLNQGFHMGLTSNTIDKEKGNGHHVIGSSWHYTSKINLVAPWSRDMRYGGDVNCDAFN